MKEKPEATIKPKKYSYLFNLNTQFQILAKINKINKYIKQA